MWHSLFILQFVLENLFIFSPNNRLSCTHCVSCDMLERIVISEICLIVFFAPFMKHMVNLHSVMSMKMQLMWCSFLCHYSQICSHLQNAWRKIMLSASGNLLRFRIGLLFFFAYYVKNKYLRFLATPHTFNYHQSNEKQNLTFDSGYPRHCHSLYR